VERAATLTLAAPRSKLDDVANEIVAVADRRHGFVLHSSVTSGSGGEFELRVPSGSLQDTLSDLSGLANVRSRTQNADDITQPYNALATQLDEARALRHSLLARLAQATTDVQAQALRRRIHLVSAQIRALSARFGALQNRARFATIDVTLVRERAHHSGAAGGIGGDFHDALHSLAVSFGIALRVLGVVLPLAIVASLGWLGAALLRRRRREAALF
jgi:type III secretory pathway component EscS